MGSWRLSGTAKHTKGTPDNTNNADNKPDFIHKKCQDTSCDGTQKARNTPKPVTGPAAVLSIVHWSPLVGYI